MANKKKSERIEALIRIPLAILYAIIWYCLGIIVGVLALVQFVVVLIRGKRINRISKFQNGATMYVYTNLRYLLFISNERPFPFSDLRKPFEKIE